jgi:hypothetical protein
MACLPGKESVCKKATAMLPRRGVVWVQLVAGAARFLGDKQLPLTSGQLFPVAASAWLEVDEDCRLLAQETAELFDRDALWTGFRAYMAMVLDRLVRNLEETRKREQARLERRERADERRLDMALRMLSSPLGGEAPLEDTGDDPWLLACRALGTSAGIDFRPHPERAGVPGQDRVTAIAAASGVRTRSVALKGDWWRQDVGPLVARREADGVPVALLPVSPRRCHLYDPTTGEILNVYNLILAAAEVAQCKEAALTQIRNMLERFPQERLVKDALARAAELWDAGLGN